jgi:hypothetical protein
LAPWALRGGLGWGGGLGLLASGSLCRGLLLARVVRMVRGVSEVVRRGDLRGVECAGALLTRPVTWLNTSSRPT